ncbi:MAG: hypothetical protein ACRCXZ_04400 [Patescibacteria group bacterium]
MSEQSPNLKNTQQNIEQLQTSDQKHKSLITVIKIISIIIIILTGLIIEALINQHPVFEFLQYKFFKQESIILGSIAIVVTILGSLILILAKEIFIVTNFQFNLTICFIGLTGVFLIFASFIMVDQSYNKELGYLYYFAQFLCATSIIGQVIIDGIDELKISLNSYKMFKTLLFFISLMCLLVMSSISV